MTLTMNTSRNTTVPESLSTFMCLLIDIPENGADCSEIYPQKCVKCRVRSDYLSGESVNDFGGTGHVICIFLWMLTFTIGIGGVLGNVLIIGVFRRRSCSDKGFDCLLKVLAYFDVLCCIMAVIASTCHVTYHGNWSGRGIVLLYMFYLSWIFLLFGRSASQFMTVAITIERWLVITFPFRSTHWFTSTKTKVLCVIVLLVGILLSLPRSTSRYVSKNIYNQDGYDIQCLGDLDYYIKSTSLSVFWYVTLKSVHYQIDFWLPLPVLLLFNFLSFLQVRQLSEKRKEMNMSQKKEIQAVEMFLPRVIVLLLCNLGPISMYMMVHFYGVFYREMFMTTVFSICVTSSVNFVIYYYLGSTFKPEAKIVINKWLRKGDIQVRQRGSINSSAFIGNSRGIEIPRKSLVSALNENKA